MFRNTVDTLSVVTVLRKQLENAPNVMNQISCLKRLQWETSTYALTEEEGTYTSVINTCLIILIIIRYDNKGCGRSYLSQRDLDAHIAYRHNKDKNIQGGAPGIPPPAPMHSIAAFQSFLSSGNPPNVVRVSIIKKNLIGLSLFFFFCLSPFLLSLSLASSQFSTITVSQYHTHTHTHTCT